MPSPMTIHSMFLVRSAAEMRPLVWMRPFTKPMSPGRSGASWPALPAATQMARPGVASQMIQQFESYSLAGIETEKLVSPLTNREGQVLSMISQGHGNKQIAASLGINEQTVKNQMSGIMAKLHANNRTHAVVAAVWKW